jgi:hypothetical protein
VSCHSSSISISIINMSVVNLKERVNGNRPEHDVYIGRAYLEYPASVWANPFTTFKYSSEECIEKFKEYFWRSPELYKNVKNLKGKKLACWCRPDEGCHVTFLCKLANGGDSGYEGVSSDDEDDNNRRPQSLLPKKNKKAIKRARVPSE